MHGRQGLAHTGDGPVVQVCAAWKERELGCLVVMVMTMVVMVMRGGERRSSKHHNQKHCSEDLLHRLNVA